MVRNTIKALLLAALLCLPSSLCPAGEPAAGEERTITWLHADSPPMRITDGPFVGQGPSDMIHDLMQQELPGYAHRIVTANLARTLDEMKNGKRVLSVGLIANPERERIALFSLPCVLSPPIALIVRKEDLARWPGTTISIDTFIESGRLGISRGRSYGPALDAALEGIKAHDNLFVDSSERLFENLLRMLLLQRIDGVPGYLYEAVYNAKVIGAADRIAVVPITEAGDYVIGSIAAPRTEWGAAMIARVNEILLRKRSAPGYRAAFTRWLPVAVHPEFNRIYDERLLSRE